MHSAHEARRTAMRRRGLGLLAVLLAAGVAGPAAARAQEKPVSLQELLRGLSRASRLYQDGALKFSCDETISERRLSGRTRHQFEYIYVYDPGRGFIDYRTRTGARAGRPLNPEDTGVKNYVQRAYFWVMIFIQPRQARHRYEILGEDVTWGRKTIRLRFEALPPFQDGVNDWIGTAWVDPQTMQILKVEADKADLLTQQRKIENREFGAPPAGTSYYSMHVTTEFSVEKNGMMFPGRVELVATKYRVPYSGFHGTRVKLHEERTIQTYARYRFFGVRTRDEIQGFLAGAKQQEPGH